ncbi:hypothetical protein [Cupriavidus alkaliphilus]|nr:hypothetical protein [Cupriavidus alkaliphilus]MBB3014041.1 hypothetical protein [Cupriavidus alkaliphilus]
MIGTRLQFVTDKGGAPVMVNFAGSLSDAAWGFLNATAAQVRGGQEQRWR